MDSKQANEKSGRVWFEFRDLIHKEFRQLDDDIPESLS